MVLDGRVKRDIRLTGGTVLRLVSGKISKQALWLASVSPQIPLDRLVLPFVQCAWTFSHVFATMMDRCIVYCKMETCKSMASPWNGCAYAWIDPMNLNMLCCILQPGKCTAFRPNVIVDGFSNFPLAKSFSCIRCNDVAFPLCASEHGQAFCSEHWNRDRTERTSPNGNSTNRLPMR